MMQNKTTALLVRILIQMIDTIGIEQRRASFDTVNFVAFFEQELSQIRAVLSGDAGDECFFIHACIAGS